MRAFVFSGGANRGALQAGATLALLEQGITPDLIVSSSVGSINGAVLAANPSLEGVRQTAERWKTVRCDEVFPGNRAMSLWRLMRGLGSLHDNRALRRFILGLLPANVRRFSDLAVPLFVTATNYRTGELHLFGHDPQERLIDALMASCAVPPYLPPYSYRDELYIDGGFVSNLPLSVAVAQGATEIWALEIGVDAASSSPAISMRGTVMRSFEALMRMQMSRERELVRLMQQSGVVVHHIQMLHYSSIDVHDFSHSAALMDLGYQTAQTYLDARTSFAPVQPPPSPPRGFPRLELLRAAWQTSAAAQANLARMRVESLRSLWPRRQPAVVPLPVDKSGPAV
jgi:NTE family protein